ncbi:VanZ family protein [Oceanobacillus sp. CAU 1775]
MSKKYFYWLLPIGWMGIIFRSSSTPYEQQDIKPLLGQYIDLTFLEPYLDWIYFTYNGSPVSIATHGADGFIEFLIRKGAHVFVFFILCCLFKFALEKTATLTLKKQLAYSFFFTVAYAVMDEINQGFTPNRTAYFGDVILDSIGALLAIIFIYLKSIYYKT